MAAIFRYQPPVFGERRPRPFDLATMQSAYYLARAIRDLGVGHAEAGICYKHMRSHRFRNPVAYDCDEAANRILIEDR
jgi:hypothetical protein